MLTFYEKVPRHFWRIAIVKRVLPSKDSEIRGAIVRITKINTILKRLAFRCCPVNRKHLWKKTQIEKKANSTLQHLRTDFRNVMGEQCLNPLSLAYIHRDIFLDYDKIIDIYASKYPSRRLLINSLSEN